MFASSFRQIESFAAESQGEDAVQADFDVTSLEPVRTDYETLEQ